MIILFLPILYYTCFSYEEQIKPTLGFVQNANSTFIFLTSMNDFIMCLS